ARSRIARSRWTSRRLSACARSVAPPADRGAVRAHTDYLWFTTSRRRELVNITDRVAAIVAEAGVREGFCLVSAMHITAAIWVNDEESGLKQDVMEWLGGRPAAGGRPDPRSRGGN